MDSAIFLLVSLILIHWIEIYTEDSTIQCLNNLGLILVFPFTHHTDAKDSRPVQATAVPAGTKATKLQPAKTADKGKKQAAVKKAGINTTAESAEDKNKQTKPQVTHELSVVCFFMLKKYCFYILPHCNVHHWCIICNPDFSNPFGKKGIGSNDQDVQVFGIIRVFIRH